MVSLKSPLRTVIPLVAMGAILLLVSLFVIGRDVVFARNEVETEVLALTETAAEAIQFVPATQIENFLSELVKHPAIATATVYSSAGQRMTQRRPLIELSWWSSRLLPAPDAPVETCRAVATWTICLQSDTNHFRKRLAAMVTPHAILLLATAVLLLTAIKLVRASGRGRLRALATLVEGAAAESNYSLRAPEGSDDVGAMGTAVNKLFAQIHERDVTLRRRSTELEAANRELEAFSYSVSHDLRSTIASIDGFSQVLDNAYADKLDESGREYVGWIRSGVTRMHNLVGGLLQLSRVSRTDLVREQVDLSAVAETIAASLRQKDPSRKVEIAVEHGMVVEADAHMLHAVLDNLMSNAHKFTRNSESAKIEVGKKTEKGIRIYFVRDNGAGFDEAHAAKMFAPFQRLHSTSEFEGTGIGLATVKRIIERHGGTIWAEGRVNEGATFYFTLPSTSDLHSENS